MFNTHNSRPPTYINIHLITCKPLGFLNLHPIYRNLQKFTPLFEKFTKIYVNYSVNWIWPPPPPFFPGLRVGCPRRFKAGDTNEVAHKRADRLHRPCCLGGSPPAPTQWTRSQVAHVWADWLHHPSRLWGPQRFKAGEKTKSGPQKGGMATSLLPPGGSPTLQVHDKIRSGPHVG